MQVSIVSSVNSKRSLTTALLWAAFAMSLLLSVGVLVVNRAAPANQHGGPLTDEQAVAQVVTSAKEIVVAAHLHEATRGYAFVSCENETDPPYQVALDMSFQLSLDNPMRNLRDVAAAMISRGWTESPAMGEHFGQKLTKDGVTSVFYRNPSDRSFATMRQYGQCRKSADHRNDNPAWTEVGL